MSARPIHELDFGIYDNVNVTCKRVAPLTPRQQDILRCVAQGLSLKETAYALGICASTVAAHLSKARAEIRVATTAELVARFASETNCSVEPMSRTEREALSRAEREIVRMILDGRKNLEIAERRGTSVNTVASQVRRILEKTGATSRASLGAAASVRKLMGEME